MNINDLAPGSYTPVPASLAPKVAPQGSPQATPPLNINTLPQGSYTPISAPAPAAPQNSGKGALWDAAGGLLKAATQSEKGFGQDLSTLIPGAQNTADQVNAQTNAGEQRLLEAAHNESDPAKKAQILDSYSKIYGKVAPVTAGDINPAFNKTPGQVIGDAAGTALDVVAAGSYSKAASGAKFLPEAGSVANVLGDTGTLTKALPVVLPAATDVAKKTLGSTLKDIGTKTAVRAGEGAGLGYGFDVSQNLQSGKTGADAAMPGVGTAAGAIIPLGIGAFEAGAAITKDTAPRFINSLIKPKVADFSYGKDPGRTVAAMGITGNNIDDFAKNIGTARKDVGSQIGAIYSALANASIRINGNETIQKLDTAISDAAKGGKNNQGVVTSLQNVKDALLYDHSVDGEGNIVKTNAQPKDLSSLTPQEAFALKSNISALTKFTGNPSDDKTVNATLKSMYGDLKAKLNQAVGKNNPEITDLNQKYADLTSAEIATKNRTAIIGRQNMVNLPQAITGAGGLMSAIVTGNPAVALGTIGAVALEKAMGSTAVKSRIAAWLGSESPSVIQKVLQSNPGIKTVLYRALPKFAAQLGQPVTLPPQK